MAWVLKCKAFTVEGASLTSVVAVWAQRRHGVPDFADAEILSLYSVSTSPTGRLNKCSQWRYDNGLPSPRISYTKEMRAIAAGRKTHLVTVDHRAPNATGRAGGITIQTPSLTREEAEWFGAFALQLLSLRKPPAEAWAGTYGSPNCPPEIRGTITNTHTNNTNNTSPPWHE